MSPRRYLVTGGSGFLGSALVRSLVADGHRVRVLDDESRGSARRLADVQQDVECVQGDVRDADTVAGAVAGVDAVFHLAAVNGTEFFYSRPEVVLDVGVRGTLNVIDAAIRAGVEDLHVASSSEVYQSPEQVPTPEAVPLVVPDPTNPRYSYGGSKIIGELLAIHVGRGHFERILVFRPHNVYGPDMGTEHVIPEFSLRLHELARETEGRIRFPIQGSGRETRAFIHVDDFVAGLRLAAQRAGAVEIVHIGTRDEISIADLAARVARSFGREIEIVPGPVQPGSTPRRCPDIAKLEGWGFAPKVGLDEGIPAVARWYAEHAAALPSKRGVLTTPA